MSAHRGFSSCAPPLDSRNPKDCVGPSATRRASSEVGCFDGGPRRSEDRLSISTVADRPRGRRHHSLSLIAPRSGHQLVADSTPLERPHPILLLASKLRRARRLTFGSASHIRASPSNEIPSASRSEEHHPLFFSPAELSKNLERP
jgi:hypothetical protein